MEPRKIKRNPAEQADDENMRATVEKQNGIIEKQNLLIRYLAEMNDVYIPEEEEEEDVQHINEIEETV